MTTIKKNTAKIYNKIKLNDHFDKECELCDATIKINDIMSQITFINTTKDSNDPILEFYFCEVCAVKKKLTVDENRKTVEDIFYMIMDLREKSEKI